MTRAGLRRRNRATVAGLVAILGLMTGLVATSETLYRLFCEATGYGGTTQRADAESGRVLERTVTVRFDANVDPALPWSFRPVQKEMTVRVGERALAFYTATNNAPRAVAGQATFNVTPDKAGLYFNKIACFCFTEQSLAAGQTVQMPVSFFVDPKIAEDRNAGDVTAITLSYTFFRAPTRQARAN